MQSKTNRTAVAAWLAFASAGMFVVLLLLLHVVKSDLDPSWHFISEYAIGKHGWIMQAAFLVSGARKPRIVRGDPKLHAGTVGADRLVLVPCWDHWNSTGRSFHSGPNQHRPRGCNDEWESSLSWRCARSCRVPRNTGIQREAAAQRTLEIGPKIGFSGDLDPYSGFLVSFVATVAIATQHGGVFGPNTPVGWPNRLGILSGCAWLMIVSWRASGMKCQSSENSAGL